MLLLQGQEAEAQTIWAFAIAQGDLEQVEAWTIELIDILQGEAQRQENIGEPQTALLVRLHIRELAPENLDNLLGILRVAKKSDRFPEADLVLSQIGDFLESDRVSQLEASQLIGGLQQILELAPEDTATVRFAEACLAADQDSPVIGEILLNKIIQLSAEGNLVPPMLDLAKLSLRLNPDNGFLLARLSQLCQDAGNYSESADYALLLLEKGNIEGVWSKPVDRHGIPLAGSPQTPLKNAIGFFSPTFAKGGFGGDSGATTFEHIENRIRAYHLAISSLLKMGGEWESAYNLLQEFQELLRSIQVENRQIEPILFQDLMVTLAFPSYFADEPQATHEFRNQLACFYQGRVRQELSQGREVYNKRDRISKTDCNPEKSRLCIGYLSSCFYRHSVGWLVRWLFEESDRDRFDIYAYSLTRRPDNLQQYLANLVTKFTDLSASSPQQIAESIAEDEIDILVDLDSITYRLVSPVLALKPAPIQITWLGWDASGLPGVDYFVADPYVLPDSASDYYAAKIWRLPETYIAVNGFEVGVPTLRRDDLGITENAVVYLSSQTGYKRNPENARLQLQIIKEVPNSYFLVKNIGDIESVRAFFQQIAAEVGLEQERLRFLPQVDSEEIHRANLGIADIVLDTYPYNGATTTLETLWMGIPVVTRVGEQFAARNSYAMMMNAGVTEGIAWSNEEYVEWGIRLGTDPDLRQEISWRLYQSRQTSPLWNATQFSRDMEKAYREMWQNYVEAW
ncbi:MAG: O-linked N-acetylglucosamine transferase, SPINDLY family protein [Oscillatoria sp. SIO1A7]|nr:O-linked N-acetylglucosamine transferase, SPINDLY family protein [Oscillatoria sp. SIO1A7]